MILDYLNPNVYLPRDEWEKAVGDRKKERLGEKWILERIREMAYKDREESEINTHPLVYIGADNKGTDQLLAFPGGKNRDSHGSYPFPGLYKDVGPAAAAEQINAPFNDHYEIYRGKQIDRVERYDDPDKIEIVPDWEPVIDLIQEHPQARKEWSWLVLPIRWGYPAVKSPFAGVIRHANTGNLAPVGPAYNTAWNRVGAVQNYELYDPHKFGSSFPLGWQDSFINSWGFLNLTLPTLVILPPFDFTWRVALAPPRHLLQTQGPTFFPRESIPFRLFGVAGGVSVSFLPDEFVLLFTSQAQYQEIRGFIDGVGVPTLIENEEAGTTVSQMGQFNIYLGRNLSSENMIRYSTSVVSFDIRQPTLDQVVTVRGDFEMWEYSGSVRYNFAMDRFQPFIKAGYGLSWYRLKNATLGGEPLANPETDWVREPSLFPPRNLLPNTWHLGVGIEFLPITSFASFPKGVDIGLRLNYSVYFHALGLRRPELLSDQEDVTLGRTHLNFLLTVSF